MECRLDCGACCIASSISTPISGMPEGKAAGVRCAQLNDDNLCRLFGHLSRPVVCERFKPDCAICTNDPHRALIILTELESLTE
ncbi:MAG: YkgJ family cysteine cluster protein [Endozoicomonas sp.]